MTALADLALALPLAVAALLVHRDRALRRRASRRATRRRILRYAP